MGLSLKKIVKPVVNPVSSLTGLFKTKYDTQGQVPLETPEQSQARRLLMDFATSGKYGDFTVGQELPLGYGDFSITQPESMGQSALQDLLSSTLPDQFSLGDAALKDVLATSPEAINAQFEPFSTQLKRSTREGMDAVKRAAAFGGNLYSKETIRQLGDVQARANETVTAELSRLINESLNRRLSAIPLAYQSAQAQEAAKIGRINASQVYGSLTRDLNNQRIQARDNEILRRRQELQLPITAAGTVVGSPVQFGVPSVSVPKNNDFLDLLRLAVQGGAMYAGAKR